MLSCLLPGNYRVFTVIYLLPPNLARGKVICQYRGKISGSCRSLLTYRRYRALPLTCTFRYHSIRTTRTKHAQPWRFPRRNEQPTIATLIDLRSPYKFSDHCARYQRQCRLPSKSQNCASSSTDPHRSTKRPKNNTIPPAG